MAGSENGKTEVEEPLPGVLTEEDLEKMAQDQLNEDASTRDINIKMIQTWIGEQPHLQSNVRTDEQHILGFLRGCKFNLEKTKRKILTHYLERTANPDWFQNWDVNDPFVKHCLDTGVCVPLKGYDRLGRKVILNRPGLIDAKKYTISDMFKFSFMITDLTQEKYAQSIVTGVVPVVVRHLVTQPQNAVLVSGPLQEAAMTFSLITSFSPLQGKKAMEIWQGAYPNRPKEIHFLNMPKIVYFMYKLVKSAMKGKLQERLKVHAQGDITGLQEAVGLEVLPEEYGGTNGKLQDHIDALKESFRDNEEFFKKQGMLRIHHDNN